jgi:hypothetical protein
MAQSLPWSRLSVTVRPDVVEVLPVTNTPLAIGHSVHCVQLYIGTIVALVLAQRQRHRQA